MLNKGDRFRLSTDERYRECGDKNTVYVDYKSITDLPLDASIHIDDGLIFARVVEKGINYLVTGQYGDLYNIIRMCGFYSFFHQYSSLLLPFPIQITSSFLHHVSTEVLDGGKLGSWKGINFPGVKVNLPAVCERDIEDLKFGVEQDVDMVFASFIRKASDVHAVREVLGEKGKHILIVSKV